MKILRFLLILVGYAFFLLVSGWHLSTAEFIKTWDINDTSKTIKAEATNIDVRQHLNAQVFQKRLKELNAY
ncbi:hypothetical protein [Arachidicoccus sp.]|uniref:hypothetical protein n=1 Tax=Arachidicoccus sp. TaxID=1872624 RepID=UPI003D19E535